MATTERSNLMAGERAFNTLAHYMNTCPVPHDETYGSALTDLLSDFRRYFGAETFERCVEEARSKGIVNR